MIGLNKIDAASLCQLKVFPTYGAFGGAFEQQALALSSVPSPNRIDMPVKLFSLRGVPDDEAEDVRALLTKHAIDYYETPPGNWGVSMPAIWLEDEAQLARAKSLIEDYQRARTSQARAAYAQFKAERKHRTWVDVLRENPVRFVLYLSAAVALLYLSTTPFLSLGS